MAPPPVVETMRQPLVAMPEAVTVVYWPKSVQVNVTVTGWLIHVFAVYAAPVVAFVAAAVMDGGVVSTTNEPSAVLLHPARSWPAMVTVATPSRFVCTV